MAQKEASKELLDEREQIPEWRPSAGRALHADVGVRECKVAGSNVIKVQTVKINHFGPVIGRFVLLPCLPVQ